jgi:hypothetical protein
MRRGRCIIAWLVPLAAADCSGSLPWLHGEIVNHPPALVGEWVDVQKSSPTDSSVWLLEPNGYDGGLRITYAPDQVGRPRISRRQYGYWYVRRGSAGDELCVTRRPSRDAPSCTAFETAVDSSVIPPRRVVRLCAYTGAHHTGQRVLVERR